MSQLPPGPRNALVETLRYVQNPTARLQALTRRYGDTFTLPLVLGENVVTSAPAALREVFSADPDLFEPPVELLHPLLIDESLFLNSGPRHRRDRKLMMPPFHGARMRAYGELIQEIAARLAAAWPTGERFDIADFTKTATAEAIIRAVFGVKHAGRVRAYIDLIDESSRVFTPLVIFLPFLRRSYAGLGPWPRIVDLAGRHKRMLREEIDERRREGGEHEDILSLLLAARFEDGAPMPDDALVDQLRMLVFAGHETTALSLAWAFYEVHRHPAVLARLRDELRPLGDRPAADALARLPYLGAVCDETLRLHPIGASVLRRLVRPFTLQGFELPAGTLLNLSMYLTHLREDLYPSPGSFRPERFLEAEGGRQYSPFEYLPFGGGNRRCLGAAFAHYEMRIILGAILARHRLALAHAMPIETHQGLTFNPKGGVPMIRTGSM